MLFDASKWRGSVWRAEVGLRIAALRRRLDGLRLSAVNQPPPELGRSRAQILNAIGEALGDAESVIEDTSPPQNWREWLQRIPRRLSDWWTGSALTAGWGFVHRAEADMVLVEANEDVRSTLPWLRAWVQSAMAPGYRRSLYEKQLKEQIESRDTLERVVIRQAHKDVIHSNSERFVALRGFRNTLVLVTLMLVALVGILAVWHALDPDFLELCMGASGDGEAARCVSGSESARFDVFLVALVGSLGGMLAIALGLGEKATAPSRYDPKAWQALLKPAAGAATALGGVLLVQADVVVGPTSSPSEALYLSYALIFGFSQQLFTRLVDKRAGVLGGDGTDVEQVASEPIKSSTESRGDAKDGEPAEGRGR
jgi:hypothetical protein